VGVGKDNFCLARTNPLYPKGQEMKSRNGESQMGITSKTLHHLSHLDLWSVRGHIILDGIPDQLK